MFVIQEKEVLGAHSLSVFGLYGVLIEIVVIFYILIASLAGLYYHCPRLRPYKSDTDMTKVIYNCAVLLILSSALPVLCVLLGKYTTAYCYSLPSSSLCYSTRWTENYC